MPRRRTRLMWGQKTVNVLVVEDNPMDAELARLLLEDIGLAYQVKVARNGDEAMQYLSREGPHDEAFTPDLILVDLNLPKLSGFAVLEQVNELRARGERVTAVAVWSGSADPANRDAAGVLGADGYFVKAAPGTPQYLELITGFRAFWDRMSSGSSAG